MSIKTNQISEYRETTATKVNLYLAVNLSQPFVITIVTYIIEYKRLNSSDTSNDVQNSSLFSKLNELERMTLLIKL